MQNVFERVMPRDMRNEKKGIEREDAGGYGSQVGDISMIVLLFLSIVYLFYSWWNHVCRSMQQMLST
jgi:hypothetical protein